MTISFTKPIVLFCLFVGRKFVANEIGFPQTHSGNFLSMSASFLQKCGCRNALLVSCYSCSQTESPLKHIHLIRKEEERESEYRWMRPVPETWTFNLEVDLKIETNF
jgi:hypothetical protein